MNMAITMNGLKGLAGRMTDKVTGSKGGDHTTLIMQTVRKMASKESSKVPLVGHLPVDKQYLYTGGTLIVSLLLAAGFTIYSSVQLDNRSGYEARSGELKVLSQRLPLTAQQSVLGNGGACDWWSRPRDLGRHQCAVAEIATRGGADPVAAEEPDCDEQERQAH